MQANNAPHALDAIVHIGAGRGKDLEHLLASGVRRIVLVDADRHAAAALRRLAGAVDRGAVDIEVIEAAVAGVEKDAELLIYNLERVSGVRPAQGLHEVYPGLVVQRALTLTTTPSSALIKGLDLDPFARNRLILDTPGEERAILERLQSDDLLDVFSEIEVSVCMDVLYEGAAAPEDIVTQLQGASFHVRVEQEGLWRHLKARSDRSPQDRLAIERQAKQMSAVEAKNAELESRIAQLQAKPVDVIDRKLLFEGELNRCEAQLDLLQNILLGHRGQ